MNGSRRLVLAAAMAMAVATPNARAGDGPKPSPYRLEGTWDVVLTFGDGSQVRSVLTVIPGITPDGGSIVHSAELSLVPPNPTLPEQGAWRRAGHRRFVASYRGFAFDEALQPFGRIGFRHAITLSKNALSFTGQAVFEVIDRDGNVLFSDPAVQSYGVRQPAEGP
jgi:hypothetical protein